MPKLLGEALHRRGLQRHAAAGGRRRARVAGDHLVALPDDLGERRHREIRRAHEHDPEGHTPAFWMPTRGVMPLPLSRLAAFWNFLVTRSRFSLDR